MVLGLGPPPGFHLLCGCGPWMVSFFPLASYVVAGGPWQAAPGLYPEHPAQWPGPCVEQDGLHTSLVRLDWAQESQSVPPMFLPSQ